MDVRFFTTRALSDMHKVEIMIKSRLKINVLVLLIAIGLLASSVGKGYAQSGTYVIQVQDVLKIAFWEYPDLNAQVKVKRDGSVDIPLVGKITAAGLSVNVMRQKIISQMSLFNRIVTQISIEVLEYGSNIVYVTGQVRKPGRYSFEEIPDLWDILLEAGGPLETALLSDILIVRADEGGKVYRADVTEALQNAALDQLMEIKPGDTIQIQASGVPGATRSPLVKQDVIYIFGAVGRQGAHNFAAGTDILQAIGNAGGPTQNANLKKVKHISVSHGSTSIVTLNLNDYMNKAAPPPMPLGPGDYIVIPQKSSFGRRLVNIVVTTTVSSILGTILFVVLRR